MRRSADVDGVCGEVHYAPSATPPRVTRQYHPDHHNLQPGITLRSLHIIYIYHLIVLYGPAVFKTQGIVSASGNRCNEVRSFASSAGVQQEYPISNMKEGSLGAKLVTRSEVSCGCTNLGGRSNVWALPDVCEVRGLVTISDALVEQ